MGRIEQFTGLAPAASARLAAKLLNKHSAGEISQAIEVLIDVLDLVGGDPDFEADDAEDSFAFTALGLHMTRRVPGDITADDDDTAYVEWDAMRGSQKRGPNLLAGHEDDEDGGDTEPNGDEHDTNNAEDDEFAGAAMQTRWSGPGCRVSDPDHCGTEGR